MLIVIRTTPTCTTGTSTNRHFCEDYEERSTGRRPPRVVGLATYLRAVAPRHAARAISGAGGWARTSTPLREGDFKTGKKRQQLNELLSCCLFSLRGLRVATVFYEGYGHPGGQRNTGTDPRSALRARWIEEESLIERARGPAPLPHGQPVVNAAG